MDGMGGLDALAAVQARIADIQARIGSLAGPMVGSTFGGAGGRLGAPDTTTTPSTSSDFASALSDASATTDSRVAGALAAGTPTAAGAIPADGDMRSPAAREQFARDLLARLGAPLTSENMRALVAWQAGEGTRAAYNPLATIRSSHQPGESQFNSVGVKNFPTYEAGLETTLAALQNGLYQPVLDALQRGTSALDVARAVAGSRWGTGTAILRALNAA